MPTELILIKDVEGLGEQGEVVSVSAGYARNFLLPKKLASVMDASSKRMVEKLRAERAARDQQRLEEARKIAETLASLSLTIPAKTGEEGKLFGSVTNADIAAALEKAGMKLDRHQIHLPKPIRELGVFEVSVKLHAEFSATLKVWVVEE